MAAALLVAFAGDGLAAQSRQSLIRHIEVTGASRVLPASVLDRTGLKEGEAYAPERASAAIAALFSTGEYKDVRISENAGAVTIALVENPTVGAVAFTGNAALKADRFKDAVKLKKGGVFSDARANADVLAIRDIYRSEGRLTTKIAVQSTPKPNNTADITFVITEGEVNRVSSIAFEGNHAFSADQLEDVITTARSGWLDILKSNSIYVADRLDDDRERLRQHYQTHGFPDAKIVTAQGTLNDDGKGYAVRFVIDEGPRFTFGSVSLDIVWPGVRQDDLQPLIVVRAGEVYDAGAIDKSTEAMVLALWDGGQKKARVKPEMKRNRELGRIDVVFHIDMAADLTIARVEVRGNTKTNVSVILREMRLREGDNFNGIVLERDKKRIKALGIFKSAITSTERAGAEDKVNVIITVVEDETLVLSVGGGYSSSEGVIGDIAVEDHNLFGTGRWVKIKLVGSLYKLQAEASFTEPHLLGTDLSGGFDLFYKDYDASTLSSFKSRKIGGDVRLGYDLSETVSGSVNYKFTQNKIYDVGADASLAIRDAIPNYPQATQSTYYTSSVGYSLAYDTRNSKKLPTSGSSFVLTQDLAGLGGDVRYIKTTVDARTYFEASKDVTLVGRASAGTISGWGGQDVRLLDMYFMGSDQVRGFATAGIGPRDTLSANQDALGGTNYFATTAEARFNLPLVPQEIGLRGAVFADAGSLFGTSTNAKKLAGLAGSSASLRSSVGVGLIWDSPIGALRVDYAIPLSKQTFDKTQAWSFGLASF